ncbi:hypothetical protein K2Z83_20720 [Oscillochloris sp. ZM17-4]|uniref:hypothetical protein n=1 Tax=Oscillochloris sp. ZM17-4 TaxID=2866714 RepID=UPI001C72E58F|nr:hypothetical protein [Oscillochloris sp. ZM17-4]MBX0330095.1 hypothetical protein [Oscillochloris sp. ZM17-4]
MNLIIDTFSTNDNYPATTPIAVLEITAETLGILQQARTKFRRVEPVTGWFAPIANVGIDSDLFDAVAETDTSPEATAWREAFERLIEGEQEHILITEPTPFFADEIDADVDFGAKFYYSDQKGFWWRWTYAQQGGVLETRAVKLEEIEARWKELHGSLPGDPSRLTVTAYADGMEPITQVELKRLPDGKSCLVGHSQLWEIVGATVITVQGQGYVSLSLEGGDYIAISREDWMAFNGFTPACCPTCGCEQLADQGNTRLEETPAQHGMPGWGITYKNGFRFRCDNCDLTFVTF